MPDDEDTTEAGTPATIDLGAPKPAAPMHRNQSTPTTPSDLGEADVPAAQSSAPPEAPSSLKDLLSIAASLAGAVSSLIAAFLQAFYGKFGVTLAEVGLDAQAIAIKAVTMTAIPFFVAMLVYTQLPRLQTRWPATAGARTATSLIFGLIVVQWMLQSAAKAYNAQLTSSLTGVSSILILFAPIVLIGGRKSTRRQFRSYAQAGLIYTVAVLTVSLYTVSTRYPVDILTNAGPADYAIRFPPGVSLIELQEVSVTPVGVNARFAIESNHRKATPDDGQLVPIPDTLPNIGYCMALMGSGGGVYVFLAQDPQGGQGAPTQILRIPTAQVVVRTPLWNIDGSDGTCENPLLLPGGPNTGAVPPE